LVTTDSIKTLRDRTGAGIMDCKRALEEANGDLSTAEEVLRRRGIAFAQKQSARETTQGLIDVYLHPGGRVGAMVELNCETDFVARTEVFKELAHGLAMQVAAMDPKYLSTQDLPAGSQENPSEVCLLSQPFIKDQGRPVQDLINDAIARLGENIRVRRFARYLLGA